MGRTGDVPIPHHEDGDHVDEDDEYKEDFESEYGDADFESEPDTPQPHHRSSPSPPPPASSSFLSSPQKSPSLARSHRNVPDAASPFRQQEAARQAAIDAAVQEALAKERAAQALY